MSFCSGIYYNKETQNCCFYNQFASTRPVNYAARQLTKLLHTVLCTISPPHPSHAVNYAARLLTKLLHTLLCTISPPHPAHAVNYAARLLTKLLHTVLCTISPPHPAHAVNYAARRLTKLSLPAATELRPSMFAAPPSHMCTFRAVDIEINLLTIDSHDPAALCTVTSCASSSLEYNDNCGLINKLT